MDSTIKTGQIIGVLGTQCLSTQCRPASWWHWPLDRSLANHEAVPKISKHGCNITYFLCGNFFGVGETGPAICCDTRCTSSSSYPVDGMCMSLLSTMGHSYTNFNTCYRIVFQDKVFASLQFVGWSVLHARKQQGAANFAKNSRRKYCYATWTTKVPRK